MYKEKNEMNFWAVLFCTVSFAIIVFVFVKACAYGDKVADKRNQEAQKPFIVAYKKCTQQCLKLGYACKTSDPYTRVCVCDTNSKAIRLEN